MVSNYSYIEHIKLAERHKKNGAQVTNISGWDITNPAKYLNFQLLDDIENQAKNFYGQYIDNKVLLESRKKHIFNLQNIYPRFFADKDSLVTNGSTESLYILLSFFKKKHVKTIYALSPYYFTLQKICDDLGLEFVHINRTSSLSVNFNDFEQHLHQVNPDCVILVTQPIYSSGLSNSFSDLTKIVELCIACKGWLLIDYAMSGIIWSSNEHIFHNQLLNVASLYKRTFFIDSPNKRALIPGIKLGLIFMPNYYSEEVENHIELLSGGVSAHQAAFFLCLAEDELSLASHAHNCGLVKDLNDTYLLALNVLVNKGWIITKPAQGIFSMVFSNNTSIKDMSIMEWCENLLEKRDLIVLPSVDFNYGEPTKFGFRINLSIPPKLLYEKLSYIIAT